MTLELKTYLEAGDVPAFKEKCHETPWVNPQQFEAVG